MAKISTILVVCALVACFIAVAESTLNCGQVAGGVAPCLTYLRGTQPLSATCCGGIRNLNSAAKTTADRQSVCTCLKSAAGTIKGINLGLASSLPGKCRVSIPYKISTSTDCSKVR